MNRIEPRNFHRLALAVRDRHATSAWLQEKLGAASRPGSDRMAEKLPERDAGSLAGTDTEILWLGGYPVILLSGGVVARFLDRYGPGVQSWAWEIDDNWSAEHFLRDRDIEIISVNVSGRFFFMHPRHTFGLLWEWCDGKMPRDAALVTARPGTLGTVSMAWTTGVVTDVEAAAAWITDVMEAEVVTGLPAGSTEVERTLDVQVGDIVVRLVSPLSDASRYARPLRERGPHVHSFALGVDDLERTRAALGDASIGVIPRADGLLTTEPADTVGLEIDWVQR